MRGRVGAVVLHLAQEAADPLKVGPVTLRARQEEVAQMAGVTRETISRVLGEWSRANLLVVGRGRVTIPDTGRLQSVLESATASAKECRKAGAQDASGRTQERVSGENIL